MSSTATPTTTCTGIKGAVKQTIIDNMVKKVAGTFKVIIADELGSEILNACMRMHDLMEFGVSLIEPLANSRQPLPPSPAIYFVAPTSQNVQLIVNDWATKDMYKEAHIYFISESSDALFQTIKISRLGRAGKIKALVDLLISFSAPETLAFSLENAHSTAKPAGAIASASAAAAATSPSNDLKYFFSPVATSSDVGVAYQKRMAKTLAQVVHTLGDEPVIRYQNSQVSKSFSELFNAEYKLLLSAMASSDPKGAEEHKKNSKPALLLIVDRSIDLAAPLIHDYHYQTMVQECAPLKNGTVYEYRPELNDPSKKDVVRECVLDELDPYWCRYRHLHFAHAASTNAIDNNALFDQQEAMSKQKKSSDASVSVHQLSAQIRQLPQMLEQQRKIGLHRNLVLLLTPFYIYEVAVVEQLILESVVDKKGAVYKDVMKRIMKLKDAGTARTETKDMLRIGLLLALVFTKDLLGDTTAFPNLTISQEAPAAVKGLQLLMQAATSMGDASSARSFGLTKQALYKTLAEKLANPPPIYQYQLRALMEQCAVGTLPPAQYPFLKAADESKLNPSNFTVGGGAASSSIVTKSLRAAKSSSSTASSTASGKSIDLGHGELVPLLTGPRIVVFVVGGATRGELRCAYEATRAKKREIIIGSTCTLSSNNFVTQLGQL